MNLVYFLSGVFLHALGASAAALLVVVAIVFPIFRRNQK